jgi:hypothetical protein
LEGSFTRRLRYRSFSIGRGRRGAEEFSRIKRVRSGQSHHGEYPSPGHIWRPLDACSTGIDCYAQDTAAEVNSCKAISDDKQRLRCFDGLFGGPSKAQNPSEEKQVGESPEAKQGNWSIDEPKSSNGSPQVVAANLVGDIVLILRCKDQKTEAAFSTRYNYLGYQSVDVQLRINDQNPIKKSGRHRSMGGPRLRLMQSPL